MCVCARVCVCVCVCVTITCNFFSSSTLPCCLHYLQLIQSFSHTSGISAPLLTGDDFRYVGPDGQITLRCEFTASNAIVDVVWLRDGVDVTTQFDSGSYTITQSPTTSSDLVFTSFDGSEHAGAYQCSLSARLGSLVSKRVSVSSAGVCVCVHVVVYKQVYLDRNELEKCMYYCNIVYVYTHAQMCS